MDCTHGDATITLYHRVSRTFDAAGEVVEERLYPDGQLSYSCPNCGRTGNGTVTDAGLPRWVVERLVDLPIVR